MSEGPLPFEDEHEMIHLGGEAAVIVPLEEYRSLRQAATYAKLHRQGSGTIRTTAEEFVNSADLPEEDRLRLLAKIASGRAARPGG